MLILDHRYDPGALTLAAARARLKEPVRREPLGRVVLAAAAAAASALALAAAVVLGPPAWARGAGAGPQQALSSQR